jgi:uncharacterized lipoprotein YehR (DUF1307 family)
MKKIVAVMLVFVMMLGLCSCASPEKSIIGTWKHQSTVLGVVTETTYIFNEDGTGEKSSVIDVAFTYSFSDDKLLIKTSTLGIENTEVYSYEFSGDKLVLTGEKDTIDLQKVE